MFQHSDSHLRRKKLEGDAINDGPNSNCHNDIIVNDVKADSGCLSVSSTRCRPKSLLLDTSIARHRHVTKKLRTLSLLLTCDRKPGQGHVVSQPRRRSPYLLYDNPLYGRPR